MIRVHKAYIYIFPILLGLFLLVNKFPLFVSSYIFNKASLLAVQGYNGSPSRIIIAENLLDSSHIIQSCRVRWLKSRITSFRSVSNDEWDALNGIIPCNEFYLSLISAIASDDPRLAQLATELYPENPETWFWLASSKTKRDPVIAVYYYKKGLVLEPTAGVRWRELADILRRSHPEEALTAYIQACYNGDPGYNGCLNAGKVAESLGDYEVALKYYRLSKFWKARELEELLESKLLSGEIP